MTRPSPFCSAARCAVFALASSTVAAPAAAAPPATCEAAEQGTIPSFFGRRPSAVASIGRETGSLGFGGETRQFATLIVPRCESGAWTLAAARRERSAIHADEYSAAYVRPFGEAFSAGIRVAHSPQGTLLPSSSGGVYASWRLLPGWVAGAALDHRRYATDDRVNIQTLTLDRYVGAMRFGAGMSASRLNASDARLNAYVEASRGDPDRYLSLRLLAGNEPEALPGGVQSRPVRGAVLIGRQPLGADWGFVLGAALIDRGAFGVRRSAEIGFVHNF